jgi:hypothetical protein
MFLIIIKLMLDEVLVALLFVAHRKRSAAMGIKGVILLSCSAGPLFWP